jgi:hypothetical protein
MADTFQNYSKTLDMPATGAIAVTVGVALDPTPRALYVGTGGTVEVETLRGDVVEFVNVPDGFILPVRAAKVVSVTDAADIIGLI